MSRRRKNPDVDEPRDLPRGVEKYVEFHAFDPKSVGPLHIQHLPTTVYHVGQMQWISYASDKWEKRVNHYIHEHDGGVRLYMPRPLIESRPVHVPEWLQRVKTFVRLGRCIGFAFIDLDKDEEESHGDRGSELYCTPNGRALLVIEDKRRIEALIWGGQLDVKAAGIVH